MPNKRQARTTSRATGHMADDLLAAVRKRLELGERRTLVAGAALLRPGARAKAFAYVEAGLLQSTLLRKDGQHAIVERIGPGSICGEGPCLHGEPSAVEIVALEPSRLVLFDRALMLRLFAEDPEFALCIARVISVKYRRLLDRFGALAGRSPSERLVELFARLDRQAGEAHPRGRRIRTSLTHEVMAAMTGLSRVTVTRSLARLRKAGVIDMIEGDYLIVGRGGADR